MPCVVCEDELVAARYKCPQCKLPYCSVACYKKHKTECVARDDAVSVKSSSDNAKTEKELTEDGMYEDILGNARIQELLKSEGVGKLLRLVAEILHDPKLSGEDTAEGRRIVALKKVRELRKGGREANLAIEELAVSLSQLKSPQQFS